MILVIKDVLGPDDILKVSDRLNALNFVDGTKAGTPSSSKTTSRLTARNSTTHH